MKMTLSIMVNQMTEDFIVDSKTNILESLMIIGQNTNLSIDSNIQYIYSKRNDQMTSVNQTFEQALIFAGDSLIIGA
ncbi:MAG: hypothetical protein PHH04_03755 [Thomasclavelia sp.]|jgi:hypothetical protein|nr:hypothetical protein [Thomasclavelia sp.]